MADPDKKITAPSGSKFLLSWAVPTSVQVKNTFDVVDATSGAPSGTKSFDGPKPKNLKGSLEVKITVSKDTKPFGFRANMPAPTSSQKMVAGGTYENAFLFIFTARDPGVYLFTVAGLKKTFTEEVTVVDSDAVSEKRQALLDIIDDWLPSSILGDQKIPDVSKIPDGVTTKDILARSGWIKDSPKNLSWTVPDGSTLPLLPKAVWTQAGAVITADGTGNLSAAKKSYNNKLLDAWNKAKAAHDSDVKAGAPDAAPDPGPQPSVQNGKYIPIDTSCISVMGALFALWGNDFKPDLTLMTKADPSNYVKASDAFAATPPIQPKPGDILFLSIGETWSGFFGHTCILVTRSDDVWTTADGGGGAIPDQTATINDKKVGWAAKGPKVPLIGSVTDGAQKALHGWVDIDKVPNSKYDAAGKKK